MVDSFASPGELQSRLHVLFKHFHINALRSIIGMSLSHPTDLDTNEYLMTK
jgi:hypothetical protein